MSDTRQRIDKWLVYARIVKTRGQAVALVENGRLRVNRERVQKPSHAIGPADVLTLTLHGRVRVLQVAGMAERRGPPAEAQKLYLDLTEFDRAPQASESGTDERE
jgi:ribosome-associated heat shock protein Hsp15